jgi:hypothetical protein
MKAAKAAAAPNAQLRRGFQQTCVYHIRGLDIDIELQQLRLAAGLIYLQYKHISVVVWGP